jgi:cytochrome c oxidase assembly factor CtaG
MLQHVVIGDLAPALAVLALRGPLLLFILPAVLLRPLARQGWLRRGLSTLLRPRVSMAIWLAAFLGWHVPVAYEAALHHPLVHDLEHLSFVVAGVLAWTQLVDPARRRELKPSGRLIVAFSMLGAGVLIADFLFFSFHPVYDTYANQAERLFGLSPLADQRLAGLVMMLEQLLVLGPCVVLLVREQLRGSPRRAIRPGEALRGHA